MPACVCVCSFVCYNNSLKLTLLLSDLDETGSKISDLVTVFFFSFLRKICRRSKITVAF